MGMSDIKGARGLGCNIVAIAKQHTAVCLAAATLRAMNLKSARRTRTFTQSHHDLINKSMHARRLCRYTWERTHAITLNTTPVPPCWKIFIITNIIVVVNIYICHIIIITTYLSVS